MQAQDRVWLQLAPSCHYRYDRYGALHMLARAHAGLPAAGVVCQPGGVARAAFLFIIAARACTCSRGMG